jgi:hypothetical protein
MFNNGLERPGAVNITVRYYRIVIFLYGQVLFHIGLDTTVLGHRFRFIECEAEIMKRCRT